VLVPHGKKGRKLTCSEQDVQDCLTALNHVIKEELIDASRVAVVGISHGGFLTTHLIGQVSTLADFRTYN
jgi:dipeptidyl aminopeptidase/acylaminoacyl peptidase